jgi:APA family basic amino acid/polyamine antiporter
MAICWSSSSVLMTLGIRESMRVNLVLVAVKLFIVLFVIVAGHVHQPGQLLAVRPDAAPREAATGLTQPLLQFLSGTEPMAFGVGGIFAGAALVFFAYIGFDVVATTAEETKNPSATCRSASSRRWRSAPCSTALSRSW